MGIVSSKGTIEKKVLYAQAVYGDEEKKAVLASLENGWLASGPKVKEFEGQVARLFGKKYAVAVNSGSSANLLAIKSLRLPKGAEVITPACTFATTVAEIVNNNLVPVFVDSVIGRYTIDEELVEQAITENTKAILVPQLVGGVCDMQRLRLLADTYNLALIDDSCDTLAPSIEGKTVASFADVTTTSFYGSHIITACGMGGMVLTDKEDLRDQVVIARDWGRVGNDSEVFEKRFNFSIDAIPYDEKFLYTELGYNLKMIEVSAAFGLEQLKKLPQFIKQRQQNFAYLCQVFSRYEPWFDLPELLYGAQTNWLAFPLSVKPDAPFKRYDLLKYLEGNGIQTRVLFSGNITRHPVYKKNGFPWRASGTLTNADYIMANSFLLGCHHGMGNKEIDYIKQTMSSFTKTIYMEQLK